MDLLREVSATLTPDIVGALIPLGSARDVFERLAPLVEHGANHLTLYGASAALQPALAAKGLREQRRLMHLLRAATPGPFAP